jgi:polysaccharide export outer membrane protein
MLIIRRIATALAILLCAAPTRAAAQDGAAAPDQAVLAPGDVLRVTVWQRPDLSGEFAIASNGSLAHPLYREGLAVTGVPLGTVDTRVRTFLSTFLARPQFVLEPLLRVNVTGAVREPKLYTLPPETTVAQAIAYAGGVSERGRRDRVRLVRQGRESEVDLTRPGSGLARTPIRSGDEIVVDQSRAFFREVFAPAMAVLGAVAAIVNVAIDSGNN